jgi:hypothetical protein
MRKANVHEKGKPQRAYPKNAVPRPRDTLLEKRRRSRVDKAAPPSRRTPG